MMVMMMIVSLKAKLMAMVIENDDHGRCSRRRHRSIQHRCGDDVDGCDGNSRSWSLNKRVSIGWVCLMVRWTLDSIDSNVSLQQDGFDWIGFAIECGFGQRVR